MGSRLYVGGGEGGESRKWETANAADLALLRMNADGSSAYNLYTRDIIDAIRPLTGIGSFLTFGDAYGGWIEFMNGLVDEGAIKEWKALPYDWRLATDGFWRTGKDMGNGNVTYTQAPDGVPYLIAQLLDIAARSPSGKVTIVAHSNGGLVAKNLIRYLEQTSHPLLEKIDTLVLVASPQAGTPKAVRELLHGVDMPGQQTVREVLQYMPGAYGLLPSRRYMSLGAEPVVEVDASVKDAPVLQDLAGTAITSYDTLHSFLTGASGARGGAATLGYKHPNRLDAGILDGAGAMHDVVDTWHAPSSVRVVEVVGTGLWTPRGVRYSGAKERTQSGTAVTTLRTEWLANMRGDGTVEAVSAESGEADATYYFGMGDYNANKKENLIHGTILSAAPVQELVRTNILGGNEKTPLFMNTTGVTSPFPRVEFRAYSPVDIHLYQGGLHTGVTDGVSTDLGRPFEADIPNSYYEEWTDVKYAGASLSDGSVNVELDGNGWGTFTFVADRYEGEQKEGTYTWKDVPVGPRSVGTMEVSEGAAPVLTYDVDGDGKTDALLAPGGQGATVPAALYLTAVRAVVRDAAMPAWLRVWINARLVLVDAEIKKGRKGNMVAAKALLATVLATLDRQTPTNILADDAAHIRELVQALAVRL